MNERVTLSEQEANDYFALALIANAVVDSAKKTKGHYVLVSKRHLEGLRKALELLKQKRQG